MKSITAVLSMLHEPQDKTNSATRRFRGEPVLAWTLHRLSKSTRITSVAILCWEDQMAEVEPVAEEFKAYISVRSPRTAIQQIQAVAAARRWSDGWRGGLLATCEFDRGFYAPWTLEILEKLQGDSVLIVDPSAALVDPVLIDQLITHSDTIEPLDFCFSQAAPGLSGVLIRPTLLKQLAATKMHAGSLLTYQPDFPRHDPIASPTCAPVATPLARTTERFTLDSDRQIQRMAQATVHLNGQLISTEAEQILQSLQRSPVTASLPRELVLELTTKRTTRPTYQPATHLNISRPDLALGAAKAIFTEFARADDARLTLAGVGDPLLHPDFFRIIELAKEAGITAIAIETDLVGIDPATVLRLADVAPDIVSVHLPAANQQTYQAIMGFDGFKPALENIRRLVERAQSNGVGAPLVVPTFIKCAANLGEMETWYDHWLRLLACAVITGPGNFAGQIPSMEIADMTPPRRRPCQRILSKMSILSDGTIVACEQDVLGKKALGKIPVQTLADGWSNIAALRQAHRDGDFNIHPLCGACKDWHRP